MKKKFFEYSNINGRICVNEVVYPHCPTWGEDPEVFLVYAETKEKAFHLALEHVYEGRPLESFYGTYNGDKYFGEVSCVM